MCLLLKDFIASPTLVLSIKYRPKEMNIKRRLALNGPLQLRLQAKQAE